MLATPIALLHSAPEEIDSGIEFFLRIDQHLINPVVRQAQAVESLVIQRRNGGIAAIAIAHAARQNIGHVNDRHRFLMRRSAAGRVVQRQGHREALGQVPGGRHPRTDDGVIHAKDLLLHLKNVPARRHGDTHRFAILLGEEVLIDRVLGDTATTAQVHPGLFTKGMMQAARTLGAELIHGSVTGIALKDGGGAVRGVVVEDELIEGDAVVIAMGPWSILATAWLSLPAVFGMKGHSLVFETGDAVSAQALFLECADATGAAQSPEVFPRADGTTYVCAVSSDSPLPLDPAAVAPDPGADDRLHGMCVRIAPALARAKVLARQACFRPATHDGLPLIGAVPGVAGAYVATGHGVWGILEAPATGEAMAELIVDGVARTVDIDAFAPGRLPVFDPARLRTGRGG